MFALIGAALKRPLVVGLIFVFGWETLAMALPGNLKRFTIAYYLQGLVPHAMPSDSPLSLMQQIFRDTPGLGESLLWMTIIEVICLWLAAGRWRGGSMFWSNRTGTPEPRNQLTRTV